MRIRVVVTLWMMMLCTACGLLLPPRARAAQGSTSDELAANAALAERVSHLAQMMLTARAIVPETLRQSSALLEAAMRLNPSEVRYPRLAAEAALQVHDTDAAINAYKAIKTINPDDQFALIRLIDLYVSRMDTADQRLDYLTKLVASEGIFAEVRSHAAYLAATIQVEKAQREAASKLLDEALRLMPLNPEALQKKWEIASAGLEPKARVELLLNMLKANPAQPGVMADLSAELANLGLSDLSLKWYGNALELGSAVGRGIGPADVTRYIAQLIINDQTAAAEPIIDRMLQTAPGNVDAGFLAVLVQRRGGSADKLEKAKTDALNALSVYGSDLHKQLAGPDASDATTQSIAAATQASSAQPVDVMADLRQLQDKDDPQLRAGYASLLADLAWLEIYFNGKSTEAETYLTPLRGLVPQDSPILARLEGWQFLNAGKIDEAKSKLLAASEHDDPLAKLGILQIAAQDPANKQEVKQQALKLFQEHPSGLVGAILADALRDKLELKPGQGIPPADAHQDIRKLVEDFPRAWLDFIGKPGSLYLLKADPLKVAHAYGEAVLAQVSIKNVSPYEITIGPNGALRQDLWFDLQLKGLVQQAFQGITFDRLGQRVLLKPGESVSQIVRLDQGQITGLLQSNPAVQVPMFFSVFTNPITLQTGISPGPGGQRQQLSRVVTRAASALNSENAINSATAALSTESPEVKMQLADLLAGYARAFLQQPDDKLKAKGNDMLSAIKRSATKDALPAVRTWSSYVLGRSLAASPEQREAMVKQLLGSNEWTDRLMGVVMIQSLDHEKWKDMAGAVAKDDADETIRKLASAVADFADNPVSLKQPTTEPSEQQPATEPSSASGQ